MDAMSVGRIAVIEWYLMLSSVAPLRVLYRR